MKRSALDRLVSWIGLTLAVVLLAAGALLAVASTFVTGQVTSQLSAQKVTMPTKEAYGSLDPADQAALEPYAGQPMTTGAQAEAFANHYIAAHLKAIGGGKTYEEISGEFIKMTKDPNANAEEMAKLGQTRQTMFMGETLRSILLTAYAFSTMALIMGIAAIAAFVGSVVLFVLAILGFRHAKTATGDALVNEPSAE
jgi:ABC-type multidrug transport system fused ATPase/permease subunit